MPAIKSGIFRLPALYLASMIVNVLSILTFMSYTDNSYSLINELSAESHLTYGYA